MQKTRALVFTALFSSIIFIFTAYIFHIPIGSGGGYIHLGDAFIFIAASLMPFPYALLAAAIGAGLADFASSAAIWIPATIIIKPLMALIFTSKGSRLLVKRNIAAPVLAGIICLVGYYIAEGIIYSNFIAPLASIGGGLIQFIGSMVLYYLLARAIDIAGLKEKMGFNDLRKTVRQENNRY